MQNVNPVKILKFGVIGLVFLLAWLAYLLLRKEQALKNPRKSILRAVLGFMVLTVILGVIGLISEILANGRPELVRTPKVVKLEPHASGKLGILIDLCHEQSRWRNGSIFDIVMSDIKHLIVRPDDPVPWDIKPITDRQQIDGKNLTSWTGMILGIPYHATIDQRTRDALVGWVRSGGHLVLLGFELGDRHHGANLNFVANEFGIRFNSDIVAPREWDVSKGKPYRQTVEFAEAELPTHKLFDGVDMLKLENLCTLTVEPGAQVLLTVGNRKIGWMTPESADYTNGKLTSGDQKYEFLECPWTPVAAEAPVGLTGKGRVLAIGTWELIGRDNSFINDERSKNKLFIRNLLEWLVRP